MKVIAFDLGRRLGWATNLRRKRRWGRVEFSEVRAHREGEFMQMLRGELLELASGDLRHALPPGTLRQVDVVVFETPFARGRAATRSMWGMAGVLEACASAVGRKPVLDVSVATIKKFATGSGNAPKSSMIAAAHRLGYAGDDDNEADAYCLLKYAEANLERVGK